MLRKLFQDVDGMTTKQLRDIEPRLEVWEESRVLWGWTVWDEASLLCHFKIL